MIVSFLHTAQSRIVSFFKASKVRVMAAEIVFAFLAARLFIYTGYIRYSAETKAKAFFVKSMNADFNGIYKDLNIPYDKDGFINKEAFLEVNKEKYAEGYKEYRVQGSSGSNGPYQGLLAGGAPAIRDRQSTEVTIEYTNDMGVVNYKTVKMDQKKIKKFLLFQNWKISGDNYITNDYLIQVPKGASVVIGGTELSKEYLKTEEYGNDSYVIPHIFKGTYEVVVSKENMEDYTTQVNTANGKYVVNAMKIKPEAVQKAVSQAASDIQLFYTAAFKGKDFTDLEGVICLPEVKEEIGSYYTGIVSDIESDKKISLEVGDIKPETSYYLNDDGKFYIRIILNYNYNGVYESNDWYGNKMNGSYSGYRNATLEYCLNGSDLQLSSLSGLEL